jgi:hypothetical protein
MAAKKLTFSLTVALALMAGTMAAEAKSCRTIGGLAEMPTRGIAEFMADAALKNAIAAHNMTAAGPITMKCKDGSVTTTCTARRRACG